MTGRTDLFDVCVCGHRRLEHDAHGCAGCQRDEELHLTFLSVPATARLERELPVPVVCRAFMQRVHKTGGGKEGQDSTPESGW